MQEKLLDFCEFFRGKGKPPRNSSGVFFAITPKQNYELSNSEGYVSICNNVNQSVYSCASSNRDSSGIIAISSLCIGQSNRLRSSRGVGVLNSQNFVSYNVVASLNSIAIAILYGYASCDRSNLSSIGVLDDVSVNNDHLDVIAVQQVQCVRNVLGSRANSVIVSLEQLGAGQTNILGVLRRVYIQDNGILGQVVLVSAVDSNLAGGRAAYAANLQSGAGYSQRVTGYVLDLRQLAFLGLDCAVADYVALQTSVLVGFGGVVGNFLTNLVPVSVPIHTLYTE